MNKYAKWQSEIVRIIEERFDATTSDAHHSYASRDLIGIASDWSFANLLCNEQARKEGYEIKGDAIWELGNLKQTQSYEGEGEFQIEEITVNELI